MKVADVVDVEAFNADIGRSTLLTTEIPGVSLAQVSSPAVAASIAEQAGADLAVINRIPIDGFGFVRRHDRRWPMQAQYPEYEKFLVSFLPQPWPGRLASLFGRAALLVLEDVIEHERTSLRTSCCPPSLRGYQRVQLLPADHREAIRRSAILLGTRQLCRWLGQPRNSPLDSPLVTSRVRRINELIADAEPPIHS